MRLPLASERVDINLRTTSDIRTPGRCYTTLLWAVLREDVAIVRWFVTSERVKAIDSGEPRLQRRRN